MIFSEIFELFRKFVMNSVFLRVLSKNSVIRGPNFSEKFLISAKKASKFSVKILFLKKTRGNYSEIFPRCSIEASFRVFFSFHFKNYMLPLSPVCPKSFPICPWKRGTRFDSAFWKSPLRSFRCRRDDQRTPDSHSWFSLISSYLDFWEKAAQPSRIGSWHA